jgi:4-methyl-5(b-hydroxyethyl)-thiazole monophosphate biosynthesis
MKALVVLFDGFEDIEAAAAIDLMKRAGIQVTTAGLISLTVESSSGLRVTANKRLVDVTETHDALILPGGPGYRNLVNSSAVIELIKKYDREKKLIAAICAAPAALAKAGIMEDRPATIYPGMERELPRPRDAKLVISQNIITSKGPGTALDFSLKIVEVLVGKTAADKIKKSICLE